MTVYVFFVWLLVGTPPTTAVIGFQADTMAACEAKWKAQLKGQPAMTDIGKCHAEKVWLHVVDRSVRREVVAED